MTPRSSHCLTFPNCSVCAADSFMPHLKGSQRFAVGAGVAIGAGLFFGCSFDPAQYAIDHAQVRPPLSLSPRMNDTGLAHWHLQARASVWGAEVCPLWSSAGEELAVLRVERGHAGLHLLPLLRHLPRVAMVSLVLTLPGYGPAKDNQVSKRRQRLTSRRQGYWAAGGSRGLDTIDSHEP